MACNENSEYICSACSQGHYILDDYVKMNCGHFACYKCLETKHMNNRWDPDFEYFTCHFCGQLEEVQYYDDDELVKIKQDLNTNFKTLHKSMIQKLNNLFKRFDDTKEVLKFKIEYLKEEIDVRVESLKIEIDKHADELKLKLNDIAVDIERSNIDSFKTEVLDFELKDKNMFEDHKTLLVDLEKKIAEVQVTLKKLNKTLNFEVSDTVIDDGLILKSTKSTSVVKLLELDKDEKTKDICVLSNGSFLYLSDCYLTIYNESLDQNHIKLEKFINENVKEIKVEKPYDFSHLASCGKYIYICSQKHGYVFKLNYELEFINFKKVCERFGNICTYGDKLYIQYVDWIDCWTNDFHLISTFDIEPYSIRAICVLKNTLCLIDRDNIYYYDLNSFKYKFHFKVYEYATNLNLSIQNGLIVASTCDGSLHYFDENGNLVKFIENIDPLNMGCEKAVPYNDNILLWIEESDNLQILAIST